MMKNMKRHTKPVISIVLALVLIVSTVAVGIIATNAAYLNGKPNGTAAANAADAGTAGAKADAASVGAKAPEAVGAKVDSDSVGAINAGGSTNTHGIYFKSKNSSTYDVEYYNAVDVDITITVADFKLDSSNNLYFQVKRYSDNYYFGNNNYINGPGNSTTLGGGSTSGGYFKNANNYITITFRLKIENGNAVMYWVSGTSTAYSISYNTPTNGSFTTAPASANSGSTVTVVATPATGYQVESFTVTNSSTSAAITTTNSGNTYTFTMPSANVTVNATFTQASYTVSANPTGCSITGLSSPYHYGDTVAFTVAPETGYALKSLTVKQGSTTITTTNTGGNAYTFTMPAGNVTITAVCANTAGTATIYFKSATAYVYVPYVSVNGGAEVKMTVDRYLTNSANSYNPKSETGSLRYAWYKAEISGLNTTSATTVKVRGQDTYMEATGSFNITDGGTIYLACDNLMEGSTLVDISSLATDLEALDFYDTPLNMIDN